MPRLLDPILSQALERANPNVAHFVEVSAPDAGKVLRRAADQFLVPVSQTPSNSIAADPAGTLTIASSTSTLVNFGVDDDHNTVNLPRVALAPNSLRGLTWLVDPAFGRTVLRKFTALIRRRNLGIKNDLHLFIYRRSSTNGQTVFEPVIAHPVLWKSTPAKWSVISPLFQVLANVEFDLSDLHLEIGRSNVAPILSEPVGEEQAYYFVIEPVNSTADDDFFWSRDYTSARAIAGVGEFVDRRWFRTDGTAAFAWRLDETVPDGVPVASITIESYLPSAQAVYSLVLPKLPSAPSVGNIVFESGVPTGASATLELSTAGPTGPWTLVKDGDPVTTKQLAYHIRVTLTSNASHRVAPRVAAMGVQFVVPVDVTAESIVETVSAEVDVPFCAASIGEGKVSVLRTGRRDYRDLGADLASTSASSKMDVRVWLGSRHPQVPRDRWMLVDRADVNDRDPSATAEQFGLLSYLKRLKRKIPTIVESVNQVFTVTSAGLDHVTVSPALPVVDTGAYDSGDYYLRVRSSTQPNIGTGYVQQIDSSSGSNTVNFAEPLPGTLAAGDTVEIHSGSYAQTGLLWADADPADVWFEILTVQLNIPVDRIGRADLGRGGRGGYPPSVFDRAPDDTDTQDKLRVTFATQDQESADKLIDQLSFIMGGATVEVGGQIVFRQIYPLRDVNGQVVVPAEPIAATFDPRNTYSLNTPTALEQRIPQLSCAFGVNLTAVSKDAQPASTTNFVDVDALAWLDDQSVDDLAPAAVPAEIARWCFNSTDNGEYLAAMLTQQVVRAASTGLRVWSWNTTEARPQLVVGDRVAMVTDQYTDYDPTRQLPIRGWFAYALVLVSVQAGGKQFRGYLMGLTDAVQLKGGPGTLAVADSPEKSEILSVSFTDSVDGTTRTYIVTGGSSVATIHAHHRVWPVGTAGDPYDFSTFEDTVASADLTIARPDPVDGKFRFTIAHPKRGTQVPILMVPRLGPPSLAAGANVWKEMLDPAPPAVSAKLHPHVTGATAELEIDVTAGVSDWPVLVEVFEGALDSTPILATSITAATVLNGSTFPVLAARALPEGKDSLTWRARLTNVAGEEFWAGPASANRDPLPNGTVTVGSYRAAPVIVMSFDPDTDAIKVTLHDGRTKSWNRAALDAAGSPVEYIVGSTVLDDASTESAFGVDEARTNYKVEYQGGGSWVTMWGPATLHGQPSNPPTALISTIPNTNRTAEDVEITPDTQVDEQLHVYYRVGDSDTAPIFVACLSSSDRTPKAFNAGHVVGPTDYFANIDGTGSPTTILAAIALTRDQIKRHGAMIEGVDSGLQSPWLPVVLSLMEQPWLESLSAEWDQAAGAIKARVKGGAHCASVLFEFSDASNFASPLTTSSALADGADVSVSEALSGAQRGKVWYVGATPYNATALGGIAGVRQVAQIAVPAIVGEPQVSVVESGGNATITVTVDDPGAVLDNAWTNGSITTGLEADVVRLGVRTVEAHSTHTLVGTLNTWTKVIALDELHMIQVFLYLHFLDGSRELISDLGVDSDKISDVVNATVANAATVATATINWDSDTAIGTNCARYSTNAGSSWTTIDVSSALLSQFNVTRTSSKQSVLIQGKNALDGAWGNQNTIEIDSYETVTGGSGISQGTVSVDANGVYSFTVDLTSDVVSFKWLASTSGYPTDATVSTSGATVTPSSGVHTHTINSIGTISFGQTIFIAFLMYSAAGGTGTILHTIHIRGAYLNLSGSKTVNFSRSSFQPTYQTGGAPTAPIFDSSASPTNPAMVSGGLTYMTFSITLPQGVTLSQASFDGVFSSAGTALGAFNCAIYMANTLLNSGSFTPGGGAQTRNLSLSNTVTGPLMLFVSFTGPASGTADAGQAIVKDVAVTYNSPDSKKTI